MASKVWTHFEISCCSSMSQSRIPGSTKVYQLLETLLELCHGAISAVDLHFASTFPIPDFVGGFCEWKGTGERCTFRGGRSGGSSSGTGPRFVGIVPRQSCTCDDGVELLVGRESDLDCLPSLIHTSLLGSFLEFIFFEFAMQEVFLVG